MSPKRFVVTPARLADVVLIAGAAGCGLALGYFAYYYYWTGEREFSSTLARAISIGGPVLLGSALVAVLRLSPLVRLNVATSVCSLAISLLALESVATVWFGMASVQERQSRRRLAAAATSLGLAFDTRSKSEVVDNLRKAGSKAVPSMFPQGLLKRGPGGEATSVIRVDGAETLPLASVSNTLTVVCNEGGNYLTYVSDEHGFHNPPGIWNTTPVDVLALGDSFVQGWCVPSDRNFVSIVRRRYPATVSLGIEGDGPLEMLAALREYGTVLKPQIVLWCFFEGNDLADLGLATESPLLQRYLMPGFSQHLVEKQTEVDAALMTFVQEMSSKSRLSTTIEDVRALFADTRHLREKLYGIPRLSTLRGRLGLIGGQDAIGRSVSAGSENRSQSVATMMNLLEEILVEAKRSAETWGGRVVFVYLPARTRYDPKDLRPNPDRDSVLGRARAAALPIVDIHPAFMTREDRMALFPLRMADHYNDEGHALVAGAIISHLSQ